MQETFRLIFLQIEYLFTHIRTEDYIDIALVAAVFFIAFQALYQTRALQLLRGVIVFGVTGAFLFVVLPQNTFGLLVQGLLIMGIIALPWLFQDELRRALTSLGRIGRRRVYSSSFERFKEVIITVTNQLSGRGEGALIVLEGETPLEEIIKTGVPIRAESITPELLESIFRRNSPLHDGAVVLRGDLLIAAGCILPVSVERTVSSRMGTRHRAALGLSNQVPDTLVIIVSEETRSVSVAMNGRLYRHLTEERLDRWLDRFQDHIAGDDRTRWDWIKGGGIQATLINLSLAIVLAVLAWVVVSLRTNPPQEVIIGDIPLNVSSYNSDLTILNEIPEMVNAKIQTTSDKVEQISKADLSAMVNLEDLPAGDHHVPVEVTTIDERVQVVSINPSAVDVKLEPLIQVDFSPTYSILDPESIPLGYQLGDVTLSPDSISIGGPERFVQQVNEVRTEVEIAGRNNSFQETLPVAPLDAQGLLVQDVRLEPAEVLVTVPIEQTQQTRPTPVIADIRPDTIEEGYELNRVQITPPEVTLIGDDLAIQQVGDFVTTTPITLTNVFSSVTLNLPLVLPDGVSSLDELDEEIRQVQVDIQINPVTNYLPITAVPAVRGLNEQYQAQTEPGQVAVLLIGPQPVLDEIENNPSLVTVFVDAGGLEPGQYDLELEYESPSAVSVELFPSEVQLTVMEQTE